MRYPKPKEQGGRLIRQVIRTLRDAEVQLPLARGLTSHILIGVSSGPDSIALAHLLLTYGRRLAPRDTFSILHVNHAWRGKSSLQDERFVREFAKRMGVPIEVHRLAPPRKNTHYAFRSWEEAAREARKKIFAERAQALNARVLTAHQADDLAETLLWRLFTGAAQTHGGGISVVCEPEIRPFLGVRKSQILAYLREEKQSFRMDESNSDRRFLRARMRAEILPAVERIFPRAVEHLVALGLSAQKSAGQDFPPLQAIFSAAGLQGRRRHWEASLLRHSREVHLPDGWRLLKQEPERWVLEKVPS